MNVSGVRPINVAIITKTGNGYSAHLPDLPGCITGAHTSKETRDLIREAADHAAACFHRPWRSILKDAETNRRMTEIQAGC